MSVEVIARLQQLVEAQLGLRVEPATAETVLARHPAGLIDQLAAEPDRVRHLAPELTIGETYFYRHAEQLAAFREVALPQRLARGGTVRVLSAGCSTGEEPYTLAMLSAGIDRVEITGLDVNAVALARAARARYTRWSLRALPADFERRWFTRKGGEYALAPELSGTVSLRRANLADPGEPPPAMYDIVFCRNVLMYFAEERARAVLQRLVRSLLPGGFLFLGHAEQLHERIDGLVLRESHGTFYYQHVDPAAEGGDGLWFEAIGASSKRVRELTERSRGTAPPLFEASAVFAAIRAQLAADDFAGAIATLEHLPPDLAADPEARLLLAVALTEAGDPRRAAEACDALAELPEHAASAHYLHAVRRENAGDVEGALRHAERATQLGPDLALAHLRLGLLARRTGDRVTARRELGRALDTLPAEPSPRLALHGGGLGRDALVQICRTELAAIDVEGAP